MQNNSSIIYKITQFCRKAACLDLYYKIENFCKEAESTPNGFKKVAFDSRRIDQEIEYNPRRGLQNYNRSEAFITEATSQKLANFTRLQCILEDLSQEYGGDPDWLDSNTRILLSTLNKGLRIGINDGDYATSQPSVGSLDYIEELLYVRYRLGLDEISKLGSLELKKIILSKDEKLIRRDPIKNNITLPKNDIQNYDTLMEKLFGGIKATAENPEVERAVTITIKEKFIPGK